MIKAIAWFPHGGPRRRRLRAPGPSGEGAEYLLKVRTMLAWWLLCHPSPSVTSASSLPENKKQLQKAAAGDHFTPLSHAPIFVWLCLEACAGLPLSRQDCCLVEWWWTHWPWRRGTHRLLRAVHGVLNSQSSFLEPYTCAMLLMAYVQCQQSTVDTMNPYIMARTPENAHRPSASAAGGTTKFFSSQTSSGTEARSGMEPGRGEKGGSVWGEGTRTGRSVAGRRKLQGDRRRGARTEARARTPQNLVVLVCAHEPADVGPEEPMVRRAATTEVWGPGRLIQRRSRPTGEPGLVIDEATCQITPH